MATDNTGNGPIIGTLYNNNGEIMEKNNISTGEAIGIGDVNSTEKGTAARYNAGKAKLQYLPLIYLCYQMLEDYESQPAFNIIQTLSLIQSEKHRRDVNMQHLIYAYEMLTNMIPNQTEDLLPLDRICRVLELECEVWDFGAKKYAQWNWTKGMPWSAVIASATRHLIAILRGEVEDPESGIPHVGHVACNLRMLMFYLDHYPEGNDLPGSLWAKQQ